MISPAGMCGPSLLVFSDDWGRHPSSCQHLIRALPPRIPVAWINTIGTRPPRLDRATFTRALEKLRQWSGAAAPDASAGTERVAAAHPNGAGPQVFNPHMWPWFTRAFDRRLNRSLLEWQLRRVIERLPEPVVAVTTLPITADLLGRLPVAGWIYYCVDDFAEWPGLDGEPLRCMHAEQVRAADALIAVSPVLQEQIAALGRDSRLLTHGVDLEHWGRAAERPSDAARRRLAPDAAEAQHSRRALPPGIRDSKAPLALFWGVVDRRMDTAFVRRLGDALPDGTIALAGPQSDPDPSLLRSPRVVLLPPVPYGELPELASAADVLIMPYADLPVTRAMQPLKLKEYLATGKPAIVRRLPATEAWGGCLDLADSPDEFASLVLQRMEAGLPDSQRRARERLANESWPAKAQELAACIRDVACPGRRARPSDARRSRSANEQRS